MVVGGFQRLGVLIIKPGQLKAASTTVELFKSQLVAPFVEVDSSQKKAVVAMEYRSQLHRL